MVRGAKQFIRNSVLMLGNIDPSFYEALAVIFSNMGQHRQALDIYVFKLKDFDKAEECVIHH